MNLWYFSSNQFFLFDSLFFRRLFFFVCKSDIVGHEEWSIEGDYSIREKNNTVLFGGRGGT
jgi:hypothetical protein